MITDIVDIFESISFSMIIPRFHAGLGHIPTSFEVDTHVNSERRHLKNKTRVFYIKSQGFSESSLSIVATWNNDTKTRKQVTIGTLISINPSQRTHIFNGKKVVSRCPV